MELLLDNGVDVNSQRDFDMTPLAAATRAGSREAVELLVNRGADVNQFPGDSSPPLISAATRNDPEIVTTASRGGSRRQHNGVRFVDGSNGGLPRRKSLGREATPEIWC